MRNTLYAKQVGDNHKGEYVSIVQTQDGSTWVYKPRSIEIDGVWACFCIWLREKKFVYAPLFATVQETEHGGACSFIEHTFLPSKEAATRYYKRCGGLLCVTYLLGSRDLHCENLIAHGEYPVIVDLETMMAGEVRSFMEPLDAPAPEDPMDSIRDSVLYTSLLPHHVKIGDSSEDTSGFAGQLEGGLAPCQNLPFLENGEKIGPQDYVEEIVEGFKEAYAWICAHKEEILNQSPYREFESCPIRFLIRNTQVYARLIERLQQPDMQENPDLYEKQLSKLSLAFTKYAHPSVRNHVLKLYEAEAAAIRRGDIPYFYAMAGETAIRDEDGNVLYEHYFRTSAFDRSLAVLHKMNPKDCDLQCDLIRASFHAAYPLKNVVDSDKQPIQPLAEAIEGIKQFLITRSFSAADHVPAWLIPCAPYEGASGVTVTGGGLYSGRIGVALFFAALWKVNGDAQARDIAYALTMAVIRQTEKSFANNVYLHMSLGYANGLGGIIAAIWDISRYLNCPELFPSHWMEMLSDEWIQRDREHDVLGGAAGLLMAFRRIGWKNKAHYAMLGDHILNARAQWKEYNLIHHPAFESQPLTGFGHGACGIAVALQETSKMTGEKKYADAAEDMFRYVDACFNVKAGNWPDFRQHEAQCETVFMHGWCSGAPGIGMGYFLAEKNSERALNWALNCPLLSRDTLCCGNSTLIDFLVFFGRNDEARETASKITAYRSHYRVNGYQGTHVQDVGLFSGMSGIGYAFLRALHPDQIASILV